MVFIELMRNSGREGGSMVIISKHSWIIMGPDRQGAISVATTVPHDLGGVINDLRGVSISLNRLHG